MNTPSVSIAQLWNNFRTGDEKAYTSLMQNFANPLFRYGIRFVANGDFIKDCIQDVFFELWNRRERINHTESVKSYLFKALRLRIFREQSNWNYAESLNDNYEFIIEFDVETCLIEVESSAEIKLKLEKILNSLPRRQKEILYLRFYEGMDQDRIAQVMGLNRQSVYNLLHEAINSLRKHWFKEAYLLLILLLKH
jgi:RNA polymerase sigma factor (sigma-70 family)